MKDNICTMKVDEVIVDGEVHGIVDTRSGNEVSSMVEGGWGWGSMECEFV